MHSIDNVGMRLPPVLCAKSHQALIRAVGAIGESIYRKAWHRPHRQSVHLSHRKLS